MRPDSVLRLIEELAQDSGERLGLLVVDEMSGILDDLDLGVREGLCERAAGGL